MLDHLLDPDFTELADATPAQVVGAQAATAQWLADLGAATPDEIPTMGDREDARRAFTALTSPGADPLDMKSATLNLQTPVAVRQLAGMLSAYDWDFVEQAKEIRSYVVTKLVVHAENLDPKISLKALKLLGDVTEIGAFTERSEVVHRQADPNEITARVREKLERLRQLRLAPQASEPSEVLDVEDKTPPQEAPHE